MAIQTDKLEVATGGSFGAVEFGTDDDLNAYIKDVTNGQMTLSDILATVPAHAIGDHSDLATDFAPQYLDQARLTTFLNTSANAGEIGTPADAMANLTLADHVQDARLHQQVPKFVLRVAKSGQTYSTIQAAITAIPTVGADAPSATQWYEIQVSPGTYVEAVTLDKQFVQITGMGSRITRVQFDNTAAPTTYPLLIAANNTAVRGLLIKSTNVSTGANPALVINNSVSTVRLEDLDTYTPGGYSLSVGTSTSGIMAVRCYFEAVVGQSVRLQGAADFDWCEFNSGTTSNYALRVETGVTASVRRSKMSGVQFMLQLLDATLVTLEDVISTSTSTGMYTTDVSNTASTVSWNRAWGLDASTVTAGAVTVNQTSSDAITSDGDVNVNWTQPHTSKMGFGTDGSFVTVPGSYDAVDHQLVRRMDAGSDLEGCIQEILDDSIAGGTNSVIIQRVGRNVAGTGRIVEWFSRDGGVDTVLAYVDNDGTLVSTVGFSGAGAALTGIPKLLWSMTEQQAISATTSEVDFDGVAFGDRSVLGGSVAEGKTWAIKASGIYNHNTGSGGSFTIRLKAGSVVLAVYQVNVLDVAAGGWRFEGEIVSRTSGNGVVQGGFGFSLFDDQAFVSQSGGGVPQGATVNTASTFDINLSVQLSDAAATFNVETFTIMALN